MAGMPSLRRSNVARGDPGFPGDVIRIPYVNDLPPKAARQCSEPVHDMTNLHFHGLKVSPDAPPDDVLGMWPCLAKSCTPGAESTRSSPVCFGTTLIPHGESPRQVLDEMSGCHSHRGMERYAQVRRLRERVIVVRSRFH